MTNEITIFLEGGVIQDITGIQKGDKVTVVDWDTYGVPPEDLTKLKAGDAVVSTWRGSFEEADMSISLDKLKEFMQSRDTLDCYIFLSYGFRSSKSIIKPHQNKDNITVINEIDATEDEYDSLDDMVKFNDIIGEAFLKGKFFVYGYELTGP